MTRDNLAAHHDPARNGAMARIQKIGRVTFIREHDIKVLNVAGSRGSKESGVAALVKLALEEAFYPRAEAMVLRG